MSDSARLNRAGPPEREASNGNGRKARKWRQRLKGLLRRNGDSALRESIEGIIEESERQAETDGPISDHERVMLLNILKLRHLTAYDIMVPRADIVAVEVGSGVDDILAVIETKGHSRLPVYRDTLDDVLGIVHIKDVLSHLRASESFRLTSLTRDALFVAPSVRVLDLLLEMRLKRVHMAMVVDEYGGIDGLVTIEDLVEEIVGEIEDEHDVEEGPRLVRRRDGTVVADARLDVDEFEAEVGALLSEGERQDDIDTLGGLVIALAGHVPTRGELIIHESGASFEVLDADPRRVKRLRIRNLPPPPEKEEGTADERGG